ncbi:MAG: T9SS type A sorting domain-containing protein [Candidatus Latescibacteria bacterium]|nr:T9SS type A sorting domain-containing protein [Candidatus Latescibacterota bacterium]NIM21724.1 T9SS type A sorting domain-containing protein [Candidatus Latescibacterota bacterium]NIM65862.1 T9SS type A sorting domain-containing protein [Candidatus Latescibacterota bacterium]NIO02607.1 T9SS type A sorting domain-containing protein [Candidatus Latescibacterota bacterium]NIO29588.1 T9SS type A sorting domain-containing protein [Candidatus Latescibacterota bacterium]
MNSYSYDGRNKDGQLLPSGVYFYRVKAGTYSATKKMVILR